MVTLMAGSTLSWKSYENPQPNCALGLFVSEPEDKLLGKLSHKKCKVEIRRQHRWANPPPETGTYIHEKNFR